MSMKTACCSLLTCSHCQFLFGIELLWFAVWYVSHALTSPLMSVVTSGQNQFACSLLVALSMPVHPACMLPKNVCF